MGPFPVSPPADLQWEGPTKMKGQPQVLQLFSWRGCPDLRLLKG